MLASPADLEDFAVGFSLTEGIVRHAGEIEDLAIVAEDRGIEPRMWLAPEARSGRTHGGGALPGRAGADCAASKAWKKRCALCRRHVNAVFDSEMIGAAMAALPAAQALNRQTHAVHAAAFWHPTQGLVALREDVGRHNALDKLAGALARQGVDAADGLLLLSSRVSVELVQKAAMLGAPVIVAVSAPTALAVRLAEAAGITLIGVARADGCEIFTLTERIALRKVQHVA